MENRKDQSSAMRQQQQGLGNTQSTVSKPSLPFQQQQANLPPNRVEPKLVRDPKTGDYYDQNHQSGSAVQQQYAATPADTQQQGEYKRKQPKTIQHGGQKGSPQTKTQAK